MATSQNRPSQDGDSPKKRKVSPGLRRLGRILFIVMCVCIITGCIIASVLTVYILRYIETEETLDLTTIKLNYTTILYAQDESTGDYYELQRLHGSENRIWVNYEDIPQYLKDAAVALEDKRFWTHSGIDIRRTVLSFVNYLGVPLYEGTPGGSTITQQLIKNYTQDDDVLITRKVREIMHALRLEKKYSKEQILEAYLNTIPLGNNTNGVQAAANLYFDKDVSELTLAESAALVSITQNPTRFNPFTNLENLIGRQQDCLYLMHEQGLITDEEYEQALSEELVIASESAPEKLNSYQSWFVDQVIEDVIDDLVAEKGYTEAYAEQMLFRGGYRIYTTVDEEMQTYLEQKFLYDSGSFPAVINEEYPEAAFVILDLNGAIKAIAGSNRPKEGARLFSRARDAIRHPGSTIKPLASYSPALERDLIYYSMLVEDSPITINDNGVERQYPVNFYGTYLGNITVDLAIRRSTNTIPVKLVNTMGPLTSFTFMRDKLGFTTLVESRTSDGMTYSDINLAPMALGEMTDGVKPLEMAGAYQIFGNGGFYTKPYSYTKILDSEGNVVLEKNTTPVRAISGETATIMNHLLQGVTSGSQGTGTTAKFSALPVAGKTGTSDNDNNQWFIGVTPYYVGVCWMGYDIPQTIRYWNYPPPIVWKNIMGPIHQNLPVIQFQDNSNVVAMEFCTESGLIATEDCPTKSMGWYKKSNIPENCDIHGPGSNRPDDDEDEDEDRHDSSSEDDDYDPYEDDE